MLGQTRASDSLRQERSGRAEDVVSCGELW